MLFNNPFDFGILGVETDGQPKLYPYRLELMSDPNEPDGCSITGSVGLDGLFYAD